MPPTRLVGSASPDSETTAATGGRTRVPAISTAAPPMDAPTSATLVTPRWRSSATAASEVVDHPAPGLALGAGRQAEAAQVDGEGAQTPLGQVVGERPDAAQVGWVLVDQHHPDRAAADHDPVQAGPVGRREADQGRPGVGRAAAGARLLQRLQRRRGRGGRLGADRCVAWLHGRRRLVGPEQAVVSSAMAVRAAAIQRALPVIA